jgi:hypothetical protein
MIGPLAERNEHITIVYEEPYSRLTFFVKIVESVSM